jgi:hypothetical protein
MGGFLGLLIIDCAVLKPNAHGNGRDESASQCDGSVWWHVDYNNRSALNGNGQVTGLHGQLTDYSPCQFLRLILNQSVDTESALPKYPVPINSKSRICFLVNLRVPWVWTTHRTAWTIDRTSRIMVKAVTMSAGLYQLGH